MGRASPVQESRRGASDVPPWKRASDLVFLVLTLPASVPLSLAIALFIKLSSNGPVVFRQERIGYLGRPFLCLKFRTMKVDADPSTHRDHLQQLMASEKPMTKLDRRDNRLIPCGAWLRATGLDELPQLMNVWRGDMSLVGPRPCLPYEYQHYTAQHKKRFASAPGLTGLWQVSGKNRTTFGEMIQMDIWYAQHKSFWLDLKIIFLTGPALFAQVVETWIQGRGMTVSRQDQPT